MRETSFVQRFKPHEDMVEHAMGMVANLGITRARHAPTSDEYADDGPGFRDRLHRQT